MLKPLRASPVGPFGSLFPIIIYCRLGVFFQHGESLGYPANNYWEQASKRPYGPFGAKPALASAIIGVSILMDTEALAGFAMPVKA